MRAFISSEDQGRLNAALQPLFAELDDCFRPADLHYIVARMASRYTERKGAGFTHQADVVGALEAVKAVFIRENIG